MLQLLEQNQSDYSQRRNGQTAFSIKENATSQDLPGYTYSDFALNDPVQKIVDTFRSMLDSRTNRATMRKYG